MSEYYFTVKQNEILLHATAWINCESFTLSERNPSKKDKILYDSIDTKCADYANLYRKETSIFQGLRVGSGGNGDQLLKNMCLLLRETKVF